MLTFPLKRQWCDKIKIEITPSKRREKELRGTGKDIRGSFSFVIDPYREFKDKIKAQIKRGK